MTRLQRGKEDRTRADKNMELSNIFTESILMERSLGEKFEDCYTDFERAELKKRREELAKRWNAQMAQVIQGFAEATFLRDEILRIDEILGNKTDNPEDILVGLDEG